MDGFLPNGPVLRTPEPGFDPQNLDIRGWLNGELRQDSNTSDMIFSIPQLISYISTYMTLEPGDLIITGTPAGVILGTKHKHWMKPGDEYTVEITGLHRLSNRLVSAGSGPSRH
jgi:2-keto-4-pentenoate hydratase/2-oxohepta-3-ene-1,7-dioic acid hydratase in catechol pathway